MQIENLESRQLMSVSLDAATHLLTITGTDNADAIAVSVSNNQLKVSDNGVNKAFPLAAVKKLAVYARAGADQVTLDQSVLLPSVIDSGTGHPAGGPGDVIRGGGGKDTIYLKADFAFAYGGGNSDAVYNFGGSNRLFGEAGNDILSGKSAAGGTMSGYNGGAGTDTIDYSSATEGIVLRNGQVGRYFANSGTPPIVDGSSADTVGGFENFYGGKGNDFIYGTGGNNMIRANAGNDQVRAGGGDDTIDGGTGADAMFGEDGNDVFYTKDSIKDFLSGGAGHDKASSDLVDVLNSIEQQI